MLDCHLQEAVNRRFMVRFRKTLLEQRTPVSGSMDLTTRCNYRCAHCYLPENKRSSGTRPELDTKTILGLIDQITAAGCLNFLMTGGEPLLRNDFETLYRHAKACGLIVTIFTNASCVSDEHARLFRELPPVSVEISVYGASRAVYEQVTGIPGSFERAMAGIDRLQQRGVHITLKTIVMDINRHELPALQDMARKRRADFRFDPVIIPRLDGDRTPLARRLSAEEAVGIEFDDSRRARGWEKHWKEQGDNRLDGRMYVCGAGRTSFHITSDGLLKPCLMAAEPCWDLKTGDFLTGWNEHLVKVLDYTLPASSPCSSCDLIALCGYCPPFVAFESGSGQAKTEYLCRMGRLRLQRLKIK